MAAVAVIAVGAAIWCAGSVLLALLMGRVIAIGKRSRSPFSDLTSHVASHRDLAPTPLPTQARGAQTAAAPGCRPVQRPGVPAGGTEPSVRLVR